MKPHPKLTNEEIANKIHGNSITGFKTHAIPIKDGIIEALDQKDVEAKEEIEGLRKQLNSWLHCKHCGRDFYDYEGYSAHMETEIAELEKELSYFNRGDFKTAQEYESQIANQRGAQQRRIELQQEEIATHSKINEELRKDLQACIDLQAERNR